jgi:heme oxygenase
MSLSLSPELSPPLSAALRARTGAAHAEAEHSRYMTALVGGRVTAAGLAALLTRLAPVYEALESAGVRWADDDRVGRFVRPELHRTTRLRADLEHLTGGTDVPVTPAAVAYGARVEEVSRASAARFVAHHYTRYLGDLSGGQVIRAALERSLGVADGTGASFFAFPDVRAGALKQQYRGWLDETPFSPAEREELVDEALVAYRLNVAVAAELDADLARWTTA